MPEAPPTAPPPSGITVAPSAPVKSGLPNGSGITNVTAPATDLGPTKPIVKGSARAKMHADAQKIAKQGSDINSPLAIQPSPETIERPGAIEPSAQADPSPEPVDEPDKTGKEPSPATDPQQASTTPAKDPKKEKANPWKLYEAEKQKRAQVEKEAQDLRASIVPEAERTALTARVEKAEKRAQELESHIRFVDYEKSTEFQEKYQQPYQQAWTRALSELKDLTVTDPATQATRPIASEDILELVNMNLPDAIKTAKAVFGDAAEYVMSQRNEIRKLFEAQSSALEKARKDGGEHQKRMQEQTEAWFKATDAQIKQEWDKANAGVLEDEATGTYFKPREGDQEWNQSLAKGFALVDRAFSENPRDPKLKPEDRAAVVRRHAAVRNRAAAWGPLKKLATKLEAKVAELEKTLSGYKNTAPTVGGTQTSTANGQPASARSMMHDALIKLAKPQ